MRTGIDFQIALGNVKAGLFHHLCNLTRELAKTSPDNVDCLINKVIHERTSPPVDLQQIQSLAGKARLRTWNWPARLGRFWLRFGFLNRYDVIFHNWLSQLPDLKHPAHVFLIPDCIQLAINYGEERTSLAQAYYQRVIKHADAIIVWSEHTKQDVIQRLGCPEDLLHVVPLAAGPEFQPASKQAIFRMREKFDMGDKPYILFPSTSEIKKNHKTLIHAFIRLINRRPDLPHRLVFAGSRWEGSEAVFSLIDRLQLPPERFLYMGYVEDLATLVSGADLVVYPSLYEGFGLPLLEAMACGVPVIASNATSLPEVLGDAGLLFDPFNEEDLADKIEKVINDRPLHASLVKKGLNRSACYSWTKTAHNYIDVFQHAHRKKHLSKRK